MIIDFHTHCYPPRLATRAISACPDVCVGSEFFPDGTLAGVKQGMDRAGVTHSVMLPVARTPKSMRDSNDYAAKLQNENSWLTAYGSIHPYAPDVFEELERIKELGLKGIKLHTTFQDFVVDDPVCKPVYKRIAQLGFTTLFHMGSARIGADGRKTLCLPRDLARAIDWFDGATVIAAHMGGHLETREDMELLAQMPVYTDTAYVSLALGEEEVLYGLSFLNPDKILFGSDTPWNPPEQELKFWDSLPISKEMRDKIYYKNAQKLLRKAGVDI